jgi:hypothetical protein
MLAKMVEGIFTNCACLSERSKATFAKIMFVMMPITTTKSGAGIILNFFAKGR